VNLGLILFFTYGISLQTWDAIGSLEREIAVYKALRPNLRDVKFVTYGDAKDLSYKKQLDGIKIVCNKWSLPKHLYSRLVSRFYPMVWRGDTVIKTNQVPGAEVALRAAQLYRKKFIARCGYLPSNIAKVTGDSQSAHFQNVQQREAMIFGNADRVVVTTTAMRQTIIDNYSIDAAKIRVIPNYVDVSKFKPSRGFRQPNLFLYVGRLEREKNIESLLKAVEGLKIKLDIIGSGSLQNQLMDMTRESRLPVRFLGNVDNNQLPRYLNRATAFVLPSLIEHHPKALLEAMACGLPVIGTDAPGLREIIVHGETGCLCDTSSEGIRKAIVNVLADSSLRTHIGQNARAFVVEHFALQNIVDMELALLQELL